MLAESSVSLFKFLSLVDFYVTFTSDLLWSSWIDTTVKFWSIISRTYSSVIYICSLIRWNCRAEPFMSESVRCSGGLLCLHARKGKRAQSFRDRPDYLRRHSNNLNHLLSCLTLTCYFIPIVEEPLKKNTVLQRCFNCQPYLGWLVSIIHKNVINPKVFLISDALLWSSMKSIE